MRGEASDLSPHPSLVCIYQQAETGPGLAVGARFCPADPDGPETITIILTIIIMIITRIKTLSWNTILKLSEGEKVDQEMF